MTDDEDETSRLTAGMTLNEMLHSKHAAHKFVQGVNQKRAVDAVSKTTFKKLGQTVRGSCKEQRPAIWPHSSIRSSAVSSQSRRGK